MSYGKESDAMRECRESYIRDRQQERHEAMSISQATFDILDRVSRDHPELKAAYARGTNGVHVDLVVAVLFNALTDARRNPSPSKDNMT